MAGEATNTAASAASTGLSMLGGPAGIAIAAGANVLGGMMSNSANSKEASKQRKWQAYQSLVDREWNEKMAHETMNFNEAEASKAYFRNSVENKIARDWQAAQSNTAHQREVNDLRAAGLNPILSGTGGMGASSAASQAASSPSASVSSPHSSGGQGAMAHPMQNVSKDAVSSALAQSKIGLELSQMEANVNNTNMDTDLKQSSRNLNSVAYNVALHEQDYMAAKALSERENIPLRQAQKRVEDAREKLVNTQTALTSANARSAAVEANANQFAERYGLTNAERAGQAAQGATSALSNFRMFGGGGNRTFNYGPKQHQTVINNP